MTGGAFLRDGGAVDGFGVDLDVFGFLAVASLRGGYRFRIFLCFFRIEEVFFINLLQKIKK